MEITIKLNEKLIKQMFEIKLNNGKKMDEKTFKKLLFQMKLKHFNTLDEVSKEMEIQTIVQLVKSFEFLKYTMEKSERINKHNKRLKLKEGEFKSGYWSNTESNCCPKCNRSGSELSLNQEGIEHSESYLRKKYKIDFGTSYKDIIEYVGQCHRCGIGFTEIWLNHGYVHEIH